MPPAGEEDDVSATVETVRFQSCDLCGESAVADFVAGAESRRFYRDSSDGLVMCEACMFALTVRLENVGTPKEWSDLIKRAAGIIGTDPEYWSIGCVTVALDWLERGGHLT